MNFPLFLSVQMIGPLVCWLLWCNRIAQVTRLASSHGDRLLLYLTPPASLLVLALCLLGKDGARPQPWADPVLRSYVLGAWCLALAAWTFPWLGLSPRNDGAERRNRAAGAAVLGAQVGLTLAFGGAARDAIAGEGKWDPAALGLLSMAALFALWGVLEKLTGLSEAITVERDAGTALRLAALLPALGLLLGQASLNLLARGEPRRPLLMLGGTAVLFLVAVLSERGRRGRAGPRVADVVLALSYLGGAILWTCVAR